MHRGKCFPKERERCARILGVQTHPCKMNALLLHPFSPLSSFPTPCPQPTRHKPFSKVALKFGDLLSFIYPSWLNSILLSMHSVKTLNTWAIIWMTTVTAITLKIVLSAKEINKPICWLMRGKQNLWQKWVIWNTIFWRLADFIRNDSCVTIATAVCSKAGSGRRSRTLNTPAWESLGMYAHLWICTWIFASGQPQFQNLFMKSCHTNANTFFEVQTGS